MKENFKAYFLDIMTILMPGAFMVTALLNVPCLKSLFHGFFGTLDTDWIKASVYLGTAYVAGHVIYMFASMLDDLVYEKVHPVFWKDKSLTAYIVKKKEELTGISSPKVINAFKWSCAWLQKNQPDLYGNVERYLAESKFFRSLSLVFFLSAFVLLAGTLNSKFIFFALPLLSLFSLIRYITQRQKSIETAYHAVIVSLKTTFPATPDSKVLSKISKYNSDLEKLPAYERNRLKIALFKSGVFWNRLTKSLQSVFLLNKLQLAEVADELNFSYEVRWFTDDEKKFEKIKRWFDQQAIQLGKDITECRTDEYLVIPVQKEMSVKQRGNRVEIKKLLKKMENSYYPAANIKGMVELWEKTAFKQQADVELFLSKLLSKKEINTSDFKWKKIQKTRSLVKVIAGKDEGLQFFTLADRINCGCQVEYTQLDTGNAKSWFSFGIEWFGAVSFDQYDNIINTICSGTTLEPKDCYPYNKFLQNLAE